MATGVVCATVTSAMATAEKGGRLRGLARLGAVAVLSIGLTACGWENFSKTEKVIPEVLATPGSAAELVALVKRASEEHKTIRMTGSGHSHSDVAVSEQFLMTPTRLNSPLTLDRSRLKDRDEPLLARVQSGMRIRELNTYLDTQDMALQNLGGYDGQTIAGVAMTATHGSGLAYGPIASQIVSLQLVGEGGRMVQIEPSDGITDPALFPGTLEESPEIPITLIQDDTIFNAVTVSVGSMGIVYAVTLKTDRKFWLREVREFAKWQDIKAPGGFLDRVLRGDPIDDSGVQPDYYEIQYNPYAVGGDRSVLITKRYKSYERLETTGTRGQPGTDALSGLITLVEKPLSWLLNNFPLLAPFLIEQSLKAQVDEGYNNISYKIFNIGIVNYTDAMAIEVGVDLQETVTVVERAFEIADEFREQGIVHSAPASIRFVKASDALIAMQQGRPTMMLEIIIVKGVKSYMELLKSYEQKLMEEYYARPHWGLDVKVLEGESWASRIYPRWDEWKQIYREFNSQGTFDGRFTDRLEISMKDAQQ